MNLVTANNQPLTMSSREIAEVVQSRHDNVKVTIERLSERGLVTFTATQEKGNGRPAIVYHVNEEHSYIVVAQLSPEFTAALVKRWRELEEIVSIPNWIDTLSPQAQIALEDLGSQVKEQKVLIQKKNEPRSLTKMYGKNHVAQAANLWLEDMGYIRRAFKGRNKGWELTKKGKELGYGSQVHDLSVYWTDDVLDILPSTKELLEFASRHGLIDHGNH